jgi:hypothetical protein
MDTSLRIFLLTMVDEKYQSNIRVIARLNFILAFFNYCLSLHVDNYTIIVPTKCTSFLLLKAQNITICTICLCILSPYMFQPAWVIFRGRNASA